MPKNNPDPHILRQGENLYSQQTVLVAFCVDGNTQEAAQNTLLPLLPRAEQGDGLQAWWIAEDARIDGSDHPSAVFVNPDQQWLASRILHAYGLTDTCNVCASHTFVMPHEQALLDHAESLDNWLEHTDG